MKAGSRVVTNDKSSSVKCLKRGDEKFEDSKHDLELLYDFMEMNQIPLHRSIGMVLNFLMAIGKMSFKKKEDFVEAMEDFVRTVDQKWDEL